jgi:DivIVA domain-containing protein|tara:strand:+ start:7180 stop:7998 length:819 start_codon:yes stop_codon:yes gene_type:complete
MKLTPRLLETQQFPEKFRGYDRTAVNDFLLRVAMGLTDLQDRLEDVSSRITELERNSVAVGSAAPQIALSGGDTAISRAQGPVVSLTPTSVESQRMAELIELTRSAAAGAVDDVIAATRDQVADLLVDIVVAEAGQAAVEMEGSRRSELELELQELEIKASDRRKEAEQLAGLIESRRTALGDIARDLGGESNTPREEEPVISGVSPKDRAISQSVSSDDVPVISGVSQDENTDDLEDEKSLSETEPVRSAQVEDPFFAELIAKSSEQKEEE